MLSAFLHEHESTAGRRCVFFLVPSLCLLTFNHQTFYLRIWFAWELPLSLFAFENDLIDTLARGERNGHSPTPTHWGSSKYYSVSTGSPILWYPIFQMISLRCHLADPQEIPSPWTKRKEIDWNEESNSKLKPHLKLSPRSTQYIPFYRSQI